MRSLVLQVVDRFPEELWALLRHEDRLRAQGEVDGDFDFDRSLYDLAERVEDLYDSEDSESPDSLAVVAEAIEVVRGRRARAGREAKAAERADSTCVCCMGAPVIPGAIECDSCSTPRRVRVRPVQGLWPGFFGQTGTLCLGVLVLDSGEKFATTPSGAERIRRHPGDIIFTPETLEEIEPVVTYDASRPMAADSTARLACENGGTVIEPVRDLRAEASIGAYGETQRGVEARAYADLKASADRARAALEEAKRGTDQAAIDAARLAFCDATRAIGAHVAEGRVEKHVRSFSTDERDYVAVWGAKGVTFNYTTRPYSMTGRRPVASGSFVLGFKEAVDFIAKATTREQSEFAQEMAYAEAKRWAVAEAKRRGVYRVRVAS